MGQPSRHTNNTKSLINRRLLYNTILSIKAVYVVEVLEVQMGATVEV